MAAMREQAADPFQSAVARHVMPDDMTVLDMAEQAGRLTNAPLPDALLGNPFGSVRPRWGI